MERTEFWTIISKMSSEEDLDEKIEILEKELLSYKPEELISFEKHMHQLLSESYSWDLWGAAYIINGGCSDDSFDYFRAWLIAQGQEVYENAVKNPDSLADYSRLEEDVEFEDLLYICGSVYEEKTGNEISLESGHEKENPDLGENRDFDDENEMNKRYPKLCAAFY